MDQQQYELTCDIVKVDCYGMGQFRDNAGLTCALGGLYTAIDPDWAVHGFKSVSLTDRDVFMAIEKAFGINTNAQWDIVEANDNGSTKVSNRRQRVLRVLRKIYEGTL